MQLETGGRTAKKGKKMNRNTLTGLVVIAIALIGIILYSFNRPSRIESVGADRVEELLKSENVFVLQAHNPYQGELDGTDLILEDWQNIARYEDQLPADKDVPILVYCRSGRMSAMAAKQLADMRYSKIYDFDGGMKAWTASGRELVFR
ncbi:MAG: rhodanese-like domain-containing protein [Thermoplasmata archaeon]